MKKRVLLVAGSCLLAIFVPALARARAGGAASSPSPTPGVASSVTCAFSNPGYSGWCRVTQKLRPGARLRVFCSRVLSCLNDPRCSKTYCNATTIRGGWKLETVETAAKTP